jgi:hypothetical protein
MAVLLLVCGLLVGHGTKSKTNTYKIAWHEKSSTRLEFELNQNTRVRRFLVEVTSRNYLPLHDGLPLWSESFTIRGIRGTIDPALQIKVTDRAGNERYQRKAYYSNHASISNLLLVRSSAPRPPSKNKYLPVVASCRQKICKASSILVISQDLKAAAIQHISLEYIADLMGPPYCSSCKLEIRPRKPRGAGINLRVTELK